MSAVGTSSELLTSRRRQGRRRGPGRGARAHAVPYLLVLPAALVIALVLGYPMYRLVALSFQHYALAEIISHKTTWIGFTNYRTIFTDPQFWTILQRTVEFTAFNVGATMVVGTAIAMLLRNVSGWVKCWSTPPWCSCGQRL